MTSRQKSCGMAKAPPSKEAPITNSKGTKSVIEFPADEGQPVQKEARRQEAADDARDDARAEMREMNAAVEEAPTPPAAKTPPRERERDRSDRAGSERARTLELNQARDEAAKVSAELARVKALLEKEKKKNLHVPPPQAPTPPSPPPPPQPRPRQPAAVSRRRQVRNVISIFMTYH
jgi:hypothetical protein